MGQILYNAEGGKIRVEVDGNSALDWIHLMETCIREATKIVENAPTGPFEEVVLDWLSQVDSAAYEFDSWRDQDAPEWPEWFTRSTP